MQAIKIAENIYWVGAIDFKMRSFHGYLTQRGSSYNAYLIIDEKITLIDGVKAPFTAELLDRISSVIDPKKIDYLISSHVEGDHSGAIPELCRLNPGMKVFSSAQGGVSGLKRHYGDYDYTPVKTGDTLSIGKRTLQFIQLPMIHWPDNMAIYSEGDGILFSSDAFGQHYSAYERFDYECSYETIMHEAKKYYSNIVLPYSAQTKKAVEALSALKINTIAPAHGVILTKYIDDVIALYKKIYMQEQDNTAVITYDTMWGSTQKMAYAIADVFLKKGVSVKMFDLQTNHISDVITEISTCKYLAVGSSTMNGQVLASMGAFLTYLKGLSYGVKNFIAFGAYGWSGQSPKIIHDTLTSLKYVPICDPISALYVPDVPAIRTLVEEKLTAFGV